jgi:hypothetical protein
MRIHSWDRITHRSGLWRRVVMVTRLCNKTDSGCRSGRGETVCAVNATERMRRSTGSCCLSPAETCILWRLLWWSVQRCSQFSAFWLHRCDKVCGHDTVEVFKCCLVLCNYLNQARPWRRSVVWICCRVSFTQLCCEGSGGRRKSWVKWPLLSCVVRCCNFLQIYGTFSV